MAELIIYDSQGSPIESETGPNNDRIQDFFFDGVRFAIDKNQREIIIFFRAKDNRTSRSEQYYALFKYSTRSEIKNILSAVEDRIEGEYNKILDTAHNDTKFFELLSSRDSGVMPGDLSTIQDIENILSESKRVTLGVGSYTEAYEIFSELWDHDSCSKIAISENANGQSVSTYDLVIEQGDYSGLELIGDTKSDIESLREQRLADLTQEGHTSGGSNNKQNLILIGFLIAVAAVVLLLILIYVGCLVFSVSIPGTGLLPYTNSCTPTGSELTGIMTEAVYRSNLAKPWIKSLFTALA